MVLEAAKITKEYGNKLFKNQDLVKAKHKYLKAIRYIEHVGYEQDDECIALLTTCQLNL